MPGISDRHIVTNLLVCRLKRGINVNKTTKLLLELFRPKLVQMAQEIIQATKTTGLDRDIILMDLQSTFIEHLVKLYTMGDVGYPVHYLFGFPKGSMTRYVSSVITKRRKTSANMAQHWNDLNGDDDDEIVHGDSIVEFQDPTEVSRVKALARELKDIIDDGVTLRLDEYRVLKFCLDNASDARRPLSGLHIYLSRVMGVVRSRITRIWADSLLKVRDASGFEEEEMDWTTG